MRFYKFLSKKVNNHNYYEKLFLNKINQFKSIYFNIFNYF